MWGKTHCFDVQCKLSRNSMHLSHSVNRVDSQLQPELGYMHPPFSEICHQSQTVNGCLLVRDGTSYFWEKPYVYPPPLFLQITKTKYPIKHCRSTEGQTRVEQFLDLIGRVLNWSKSVTGFWVSFEKAICFRRHDMTVWLSGLNSFFCLNTVTFGAVKVFRFRLFLFPF
jgi:hypothetical protein